MERTIPVTMELTLTPCGNDAVAVNWDADELMKSEVRAEIFKALGEDKFLWEDLNGIFFFVNLHVATRVLVNMCYGVTVVK